MAKNKQESYGFWDDITEEDFLNDAHVVDEDIGAHNIKGMTIFSINDNLARHLVRVADSLKPVERRILYGMYRIGALPGKNTKSIKIVASTAELHPHGDAPIYGSMVGLAQYWKRSVPLIHGKGNFGSIDDPDGYAHQRYTEAMMSEYAYECFFEDFNIKAVTTLTNLLGIDEPNYLPSKFPNIMVNGTSGIGNGFSASIPPYNCNDIVDTVKMLIDDPEAPIDIVPDFPTGCDIVDNEELHEINTSGSGKITMRATIDIIEKPSTWELEITSIPFTVSYDKVKLKILELDKAGIIKINDLADGTICIKKDGQLTMKMSLKVIIDKSLDPKYVRHLLYKKTDLEKTIAVKFTVVGGKREIIPADLRKTILAWLEERRIYKRSLYNHTMSKYIAQIDIKNILIELLSKDNIVKTINIIRNNTLANCEKALIEEYGMNSHQASEIAGMRLNAFTADARERYIAERDELQKKLDEIRSIATSSKKIDKIIKNELEDLRKYATPRKSRLIKVSGNDIISETEHFIVFMNDGTVKKLPNPPSKSHSRAPFGAFATGVCPVSIHAANNMDSIFIMDTAGCYTFMPIHEIPNSLYNVPGNTIWSVAKLTVAPGFAPAFAKTFKTPTTKKAEKEIVKKLYDADIQFVTISANGLMKKTPLVAYIAPDGKKLNYAKGVRGAKIKENDKLVAGAIVDPARDDNYIICTAKGEYITTTAQLIPDMGKNALGVQMIRPEGDDQCVAISPIFSDDTHVVIVTAKGCAKRVELEYLKPSAKRRDNSYIASIPDDDAIVFITGCRETDVLKVSTKGGDKEYLISDIPVLGRKAKPIKIIPVPLGDNIITIDIRGEKKYI